MGSRAEDQIRQHVSLILSFINDYTGKRISSSAIQVRIEGAGKPIYKKEGYYIFMNLLQEEVTISVQAQGYQSVEKKIILQELDSREPFLKIRLQPGKYYPLLNDMTILSGKAEPFSILYAVSFQSSRFYRLLYDYTKEEEDKLHIYNSEKIDLEAKSFFIWQKTCQEYELAVIRKAEDKMLEIFEIEKPLEREYKKATTRLYPAFSGQADENGNFFLVIGDLEGEEAELYLEIFHKKKKKITTTVRVGKENNLILSD